MDNQSLQHTRPSTVKTVNIIASTIPRIAPTTFNPISLRLQCLPGINCLLHSSAIPITATAGIVIIVGKSDIYKCINMFNLLNKHEPFVLQLCNNLFYSFPLHDHKIIRYLVSFSKNICILHSFKSFSQFRCICNMLKNNEILKFSLC